MNGKLDRQLYQNILIKKLIYKYKMNKHVLLAILLITIFFILTTCGANEMFSPDPIVTEAMSPTMNLDFSNGQPAAPIPSSEQEMGYYNFAKTMYM